MKKGLLSLIAIATVALSSNATKIYVCGVKITESTSFSAGGGTVSYDNSTRTLNISNVNYEKSGSSNNGISVDEVSGNLTINMYGNVKFTISDADAVLCKCKLSGTTLTTTINVNGNAEFITKSSGHAGLKLQDGNVNLQGNGTLKITNTNSSSSACAIKGGAGTENLLFQIKDCTVESNGPRLYHLNNLSFDKTGSYGSGDYSTMSTRITFKPGNSNTVHASSVNNIHVYNGVGFFLPIDYYNKTLGFLSSSNLIGNEVQISDYKPRVVLTSDYFSDTNLLDYLRYLVPKGYLTISEMMNFTYLNIANKSISSLKGLNQFLNLHELICNNNNLTSLYGIEDFIQVLNCSNNKITSLLDLHWSNSLITLNCSNNKITSLDDLPYYIESLNCSNNLLSGMVTIKDRSPLKTLDISNNNITRLDCTNNSLTSLNVTNCTNMFMLECQNNSLTSLNVSSNTALENLYCGSNKLTSLPSLPNNISIVDVQKNQISSIPSSSLPLSLTALDCSNNKLTTLQIVGKSNLTLLDCSNNTSLTRLECRQNALYTLYVSGCTALTELYCNINQLHQLSLSGLNALSLVQINGNQIKTSAMDLLINSLRTIPAGSTGKIYVLAKNNPDEGNEITRSQVIKARNKRWIPYQFNNNNWEEIPGYFRGDVNGDGYITSADVTALYSYMLNNDSSQIVNGDVDGDGYITSGDITALYTILLDQ
jgi:Leucine-rich repeat (LRR) protein